jgi:predicted lactoylglutathione lyase
MKESVSNSSLDHKSVDAFHAAALKAGGEDNGKPGIRAHYHPNFYGAFAYDPNGNNIEVVCHVPQEK